MLTDFAVMNEKREHETREISETREVIEIFRVFRLISHVSRSLFDISSACPQNPAGSEKLKTEN
jgi:hypothetical protein